MLSDSAQKVQLALRAQDVECEVVELAESTRTAAEAASAIGCTVAQIVKSLLFKGKMSNRPVLVVASGTNRVDEKRLAALFGEPVTKPDATYVREQTGFVIGGVPPAGHRQKITTFIDRDLLQYDEIWAAAGTPFAVFKLTPDELRRITQGQVVDVRQE